MPPTHKLVLVSLAEQANDSGMFDATIRSLIERTCLSERTIRTALEWLESTGALERSRQPGEAARFRVTPERFQPPGLRQPLPDPLRQHVPDPPATVAGPPPAAIAGPLRQPLPESPLPTTTGGSSVVSVVVPESSEASKLQDKTSPLLFPPTEAEAGAGAGAGETPGPVKTGTVTFATFVERCRAGKEAAIPATHAVFVYAAQIRLPKEFVRLAWREFSARYSASQVKQLGIRGWRQKFENCVRGNWLKLWFQDERSDWSLTTAGKQAQRAAAEDRKGQQQPAAVAAQAVH